MIEERTHLLLCDVYEPEVLALPKGRFEEVTFSFFDDRCRMPLLMWPDVSGLLGGCDGCTQAKVLGAASCLRQLELDESAPYPVEKVTMQQCLHLVAPRSLVDGEQEDGGYCVTAGWLAHWQVHLDRWGFDHETAAAFFGESAKRVVLLDTLRDEGSRRALEAFAAAVQLPHRVVDVGLGHFEATLVNLVRSRSPRRRRSSDRRVERPQEQADFALALDLLGTLFREVRAESGAFAGIMDALKMLFAPGHVRVLALHQGHPAVLHVLGAASPREATDAMCSHFARCAGTHAVAEDAAGFLFRISLGDMAFGIVEVDRVAIPAALPQYINLAMLIAPVCAAVVANARAHDEVRAARESLEQSNAALQRSNDELVAARKELQSLQDVLPVCAWCKKILDEEGAWTRLAEYLADHTGAKLSHGICRPCIEKNFGGRFIPQLKLVKDEPSP